MKRKSMVLNIIVIFILVRKAAYTLSFLEGKRNFRTNMPVKVIKDEVIIYPCANCNSEYKSASWLTTHNYNAHSRGEIICELCDFKFKTKQQMNNHNTRCKKGLLRDFKCDECEFTCSAVGQELGYMKIRQHISSRHEGLIYTCDICEFRTQYKTNLDQHKYVHSAKTINCANCGYIGSTKRAMTRHIQNVHSEKIFQCEKCSFRGGSLPQINNHKRKSHNPEKLVIEVSKKMCR